MSTPLDDNAAKQYAELIIIDGLNVSNWKSDAVYESLKRGGVTASNATTAIWEGFGATLDNIAAWQLRFERLPDLLMKINTIEDIYRAKKEKKAGIIIGFQNASPIENDLDRLTLFHQLGVRIIQLTYNERNLLGNGCYERHDEGLSHFGVDAVREMNRLGILVDLSHCGDQTTLEAIEKSSKPVAITHANARSFVDFVRNKTDDALSALAERGGVIGAVSFPLFLRNGYESTLADFGDAIDDLVERVGVDHVGIANDFCQDQPHRFFEWLFAQQGTKFRPMPVKIPDPHHHPRDLELPDQMPNIASELLRRGYGSEDVSKILGGNFVRLFEDVWSGDAS
jgi:membrane dipeptidase